MLTSRNRATLCGTGAEKVPGSPEQVNLERIRITTRTPWNESERQSAVLRSLPSIWSHFQIHLELDISTCIPQTRNCSPAPTNSQAEPRSFPILNPIFTHLTTWSAQVTERHLCKSIRSMSSEASPKGSTKNPKLGNKIVIQSDKINL